MFNYFMWILLRIYTEMHSRLCKTVNLLFSVPNEGLSNTVNVPEWDFFDTFVQIYVYVQFSIKQLINCISQQSSVYPYVFVYICLCGILRNDL